MQFKVGQRVSFKLFNGNTLEGDITSVDHYGIVTVECLNGFITFNNYDLARIKELDLQIIAKLVDHDFRVRMYGQDYHVAMSPQTQQHGEVDVDMWLAEIVNLTQDELVHSDLLAETYQELAQGAMTLIVQDVLEKYR